MVFLELFEKNHWLISFNTGIYPYGVSLLTPIYFCVPSPVFGPLVAKYLAENGVSKTFRKNYQNRNLYWIFLDEVGSDQSGGILSPFMGTACLNRNTELFWMICTFCCM